ncbi:hypothetical protein [Pelagicoccus sp. SDUM812002]|uniref:hypothetical protein n=1 Tax=Pelagicoccus sp. SDUM812002 TaxID=3041266 RepID=UPI00281212C0|nr:hypothetical protein [Pelagicoccus sp. SDUM812002]
MLSNSEFGDGFLEVEILENVRSGVVNSDGINQFTAKSGWFQFSAKVTAVEDVSDAYFVMRFNKLGDAVFECKSIGDLKAGKFKIISLFQRLDYEMPEQLHFYSGMEEIRTNLVPAPYTYEFGDFVLEAESGASISDLVAVLD